MEAVVWEDTARAMRMLAVPSLVNAAAVRTGRNRRR